MKTPRLVINEARREVFVNGKEKRLTPKEFDILRDLNNAGIVISRQTLIDTIWRAEKRGIGARTVDQHIARLRRKIGKDFILTSSGYGYKFAGV